MSASPVALPPAVMDAIARALGDSHGQEVARLRELIAGLVARMRASGATPERVIVMVKDGVRGAAAAGRTDGPPLPREAIDRRDALLRDVVKWCIEEYFREV